jgi:hypothetical protein
MDGMGAACSTRLVNEKMSKNLNWRSRLENLGIRMGNIEVDLKK